MTDKQKAYIKSLVIKLALTLVEETLNADRERKWNDPQTIYHNVDLESLASNLRGYYNAAYIEAVTVDDFRKPQTVEDMYAELEYLINY